MTGFFCSNYVIDEIRQQKDIEETSTFRPLSVSAHLGFFCL
jgi:hypothetical protein